MKSHVKIVLADDDPVLRELLPAQISSPLFSFVTVGNGADLLEQLRNSDVDVVLLDVMLPDISGIKLISQICAEEDAPEVIMLTSDKSLKTGLESMRRGAYDYITKPADPDHVEALIRKAAEKHELRNQNEKLKFVVRQQNISLSTNPVYSSSKMEKIYGQAERVANLDTTLLITGDSGTGKDVLARWVHSNSKRSDVPLVSINCGALPENLFESELFGYEKGAFTGANTQKIGLIEAAEGSTIFLDEIGEIPLTMQVKLLHFLENGTFRRVGSTKDKRVNTRVVAATNKDLEKEIEDGNFRADLFYRINVISFHLPPLRERPEDIPDLVSHFLATLRERYARPNLMITDDAMSQLVNHNWDGNIRELKNTLERSVALTEGETVERIYGLKEPGTKVLRKSGSSKPELVQLGELEKQHILSVLKMVDGKREKAASILGITTRTLYRKLKEYDENV
ncbi:MAG: sigma-54-dependent transcriptional regulator [Pyrinomonadaceae bacterium]